MQRVILTGMLFLLAFTAVNAEVIQSVNFNPARFGQYERLKVSDKATFLGGMSAQSMRVQSAGTVTINESPSNGQGRLVYDILKLDATKGSLSGGDTFPGDPTLNFPNTCFGSVENCVTSSATGNLDVSFQNGKARFQAPASYTDNASRINQITTQANQLRIEAIYATIKGKLNVTGDTVLYSYRNQTASTPLRLAGNWVPLPSADGAPQNATLKWENRTTVKYADHGGETIRILVLDGGTTGGGGDKDCDRTNIPVGQEKCGMDNCGWRTRVVTCNKTTGKWNIGEWGKCSCDGPGEPRPGVWTVSSTNQTGCVNSCSSASTQYPNTACTNDVFHILSYEEMRTPCPPSIQHGQTCAAELIGTKCIFSCSLQTVGGGCSVGGSMTPTGQQCMETIKYLTCKAT